jgi:hypothetical protein
VRPNLVDFGIVELGYRYQSMIRIINNSDRQALSFVVLDVSIISHTPVFTGAQSLMATSLFPPFKVLVLFFCWLKISTFRSTDAFD